MPKEERKILAWKRGDLVMVSGSRAAYVGLYPWMEGPVKVTIGGPAKKYEPIRVSSGKDEETATVYGDQLRKVE